MRLKVWKMKPRVSRRSEARRCSGTGRDVDAVDDDPAAVGLVDAADEIEQRRLAAAGRPGERDEIAAVDGQVDRRRAPRTRTSPSR